MGRNRPGQLARLRLLVALLIRDGRECAWCGRAFTSRDGPTFDHIQPASRGGSWALGNLRLMHADCNFKRGADWPYECEM